MKLDDIWERMELDVIRTNATQKEGGYASRRSVTAGGKLKLHISTRCRRFNLYVYREGATRKRVMTIENLKGQTHAVPAKGYATGFRWPATTELTIPVDWRSGVYTCDFATGDGTRQIFFVVKPRRATSKMVVCICDNTYQAYNAMGGKSTYVYNSTEQEWSPLVSFQRPYIGDGTGLFPIWEKPLVQWMETNGYAPDYICQDDLHRRPQILDPYACLIKAGHDEYWSGKEFDCVEKFVSQGGHLAVLSGNTCWWQVRFKGSVMTCYRSPDKDPVSAKHPERSSSEFVNPPLNVPIQKLIGLRFDFGGFVNSHGHFTDKEGYGGYHAFNTHHWAFQGISIREGKYFGQEATIAGYESDGLRISWVDGRPRVAVGDFNWGLMRGPGRIMEDLHVLGLSPAGHEYTLGRDPNALIISYEPRDRGHVFNAGSTDWTHGLQMKDPVAEGITRNVLERFTAGRFPPTFVDWRPFEVTSSFRLSWGWKYVNQRSLSVRRGQELKFEAKASSGVPGDRLRYTWRLGRESIGKGRRLNFRASSRGSHRISAEVEGKHGTNKITWTIKVR